MGASIFAQGLWLGFSIAAPVGPIGVLCIRRSLADGRTAGLVSGLGAATADACYGSIAAFGLTFVSSFLLEQQLWLRLIGGLFLAYLGVRTFIARPSEQPARASGGSLTSMYTSTLLLTLTNPMTIFSFAAVFAGLGLAGAEAGYGAAAAMVAGVFCGSALWWLLLSSSVGLLRARTGPKILRWVNRASGLVIIAFAAAALLSIV